ncbi:MAG TPA: response regulator transcription factor [Steroidobacteraceae bacterium]
MSVPVPSARLVRVAIADDSNDLCMMLAELVNASPGMECVVQITAQRELLSAIAATQPDVLVLDLLFGGVSSLPMVPQLRAANLRTRIVIHSGYDIDPLATSALEGGAVAVVPKGSDPDDLIATIRRVAHT